MTPEPKPEAVDGGRAELPPSPDPICFRVMDKPCGCVKCEEYFQNKQDQRKEQDDE